MIDPMPAINLTVAWVAISLQILAVARLGLRAIYYPAMMLWSFSALFVVWFGLRQWSELWAVSAWLMVPLKLAVVIEACWYGLKPLLDRVDAVRWVLTMSLAGALAAMALDSQPLLLYSVRFVAHATCAVACLAALRFSMFANAHQRFHLAICGSYFLGATLADFNSPRTLSAHYWDIHLALAVLQAACWCGWVVLFNGLCLPESAQAYPRSVTTVG